MSLVKLAKIAVLVVVQTQLIGCVASSFEAKPVLDGRILRSIKVNADLQPQDRVAVKVNQNIQKNLYLLEIFKLSNVSSPVKISVEIADSMLRVVSQFGNTEVLESRDTHNCSQIALGADALIGSYSGSISAVSGPTSSVCIFKNRVFASLHFDTGSELTFEFSSLPITEPFEVKSQVRASDILGVSRFFGFDTQIKTYQLMTTRAKYQESVGALLPRFYIKDVLRLALGGAEGLLEASENLLPFLFPSNWFSAKISKNLKEAEMYSFASVRAQTIAKTAELLIEIDFNQRLLALYNGQIEYLKNWAGSLKNFEKTGAIPPHQSMEWSYEALKYQSDWVQLDSINKGLWIQLFAALNLQWDGMLEGQVPRLIDLGQPIQSLEELQKWAQSNLADTLRVVGQYWESTYEFAAFKELKKASLLETESHFYDFIGSGNSGLSFGSPQRIQISRNATAMLEIEEYQAKGAFQAQFLKVSSLINQLVQTDLLLNERETIVQEQLKMSLQKMVRSHAPGQNLEALTMSRTLFETQASRLTLQRVEQNVALLKSQLENSGTFSALYLESRGIK